MVGLNKRRNQGRSIANGGDCCSHDGCCQPDSKIDKRLKFARYNALVLAAKFGMAAALGVLLLPTLYLQLLDGTTISTSVSRMLSSEKPYARILSFNGSTYTPEQNDTSRSEPMKRKIKYPMTKDINLEYLLDSKDYAHFRADPLESDECRAQYDWQLTSYPNGNSMHELSLTHMLLSQKASLVNSGHWRDVFVYQDNFDTTPVVFKTQRFEHEYTLRNLDRHRRDALVAERTTESDFILNIYGFVASSGVFEYAGGGDLWFVCELEEPDDFLSDLDKLRIATQASISLATLHNFDMEGRASVAHTDISLGQFVKVGDRYKLNDFNRARFIQWHRSEDTPCPYFVGNNPGKFRSPEEYRYDPQTEKVDVYSLGNVFFSLLMEHRPFSGRISKKIRKLVGKGGRPQLSEKYKNSTDPIIVTLREAIEMCHIQDVDERATARQVELYLMRQLEKSDPGQLAKWGAKIPPVI